MYCVISNWFKNKKIKNIYIILKNKYRYNVEVVALNTFEIELKN